MFLCLADAKRCRINKEVHSVRETRRWRNNNKKKNKTMVENTEKNKREEMHAGGWTSDTETEARENRGSKERQDEG